MSKLFNYFSLAGIVAAALLGNTRSSAQCVAKPADAFKKGYLLISVTEGTTHAGYSTNNKSNTYDGNQNVVLDGDRDPLTLEYGITNHWGLGLNIGTDIFTINPGMYGFSSSSGDVKALMTEFTVDANYHYFVTHHTDLSFFASVGTSSVYIKGNEGDGQYEYNASGGIVRVGTKARYYFKNRFGLIGMLSTFASSTTPDNKKTNTVGHNYNTLIQGYAVEFGVCYRFFK